MNSLWKVYAVLEKAICKFVERLLSPFFPDPPSIEVPKSIPSKELQEIVKPEKPIAERLWLSDSETKEIRSVKEEEAVNEMVRKRFSGKPPGGIICSMETYTWYGPLDAPMPKRAKNAPVYSPEEAAILFGRGGGDEHK